MIIFDGLDNTGKSTTALNLAKKHGLEYSHYPSKKLLETYCNVVTVQEKDDKEILDFIIALISEETTDILKYDMNVIIDRFFVSTLCHQGVYPFSLDNDRNRFIVGMYNEMLNYVNPKNEKISVFVFEHQFKKVERDNLTEAQMINDENSDVYKSKLQELKPSLKKIFPKIDFYFDKQGLSDYDITKYRESTINKILKGE